MSHEVQGHSIPGLVAEADYTNARYRFVKINSSGNAELCGAADKIDGVLENNPKAGQAATVSYDGLMKVEASAAIAVGAEVSTAANGQARTAVTGDMIAGVCRVAASAAGDLCTVAMTLRSGAVVP